MGVVAAVGVYYAAAAVGAEATIALGAAMLAGSVVATQTDAGWVGEGQPEVNTPEPVTTQAIDKTSDQEEEELDAAKIGDSSGKKTKRASFSTPLDTPVDSGLQIGGGTSTGTPTSGAGVRL